MKLNEIIQFNSIYYLLNEIMNEIKSYELKTKKGRLRLGIKSAA